MQQRKNTIFPDAVKAIDTQVKQTLKVSYLKVVGYLSKFYKAKNTGRTGGVMGPLILSK